MPVWYPGMPMACYDYYAGQLRNCYAACGEADLTCGTYCGGDAVCLNQCRENTNYCNERCQVDFDERKHDVCHIWP